MNIDLKELINLLFYPVITGVIVWFFTRPKKRPKLDMTLIYVDGRSDRLKPVSGPERHPDGRPVIDRDKLYEFLIARRYRLVITNNSTDSAHKLRLTFRDGCREILGIKDIGPMPLNAGQSLEIETSSRETVQLKYAEDLRRELVRGKSPVEGLEMMLEYENARGKKFYTVYTYSSTSPKTSYKKKKGFI